MGFRDFQFGSRVRNFPDPPDFIGVWFGNKHDLMPIGGDQMTCDVQELPGVVLMDEQELQSGYPVWSSHRAKRPALPL
jgi:hypothetical protein